jgi:hypothetical protein
MLGGWDSVVTNDWATGYSFWGGWKIMHHIKINFRDYKFSLNVYPLL